MERHDEQAIIDAVLQGEVAEFRILVERYQKPIYNLMLRMTETVAASEDLTQDTFLRAFDKLHTFKRGRRFFSWLYTIAVNLGRDYLRSRGIRRNLLTEAPENFQWPDPDPDACTKKADCIITVMQVADAIKQLPLMYSEPLLLYYREELTVKEISAALGLSVSAAKVRIHRGRALLKQIMGVNDDGP